MVLYQLSYVCVRCSYNMNGSFNANASELADLILDGEISPSDLKARHDIGTKVEGEGPCPSCGPHHEGRAAELVELGWRQRGWGMDAQWMNPPGTYYVHDEILDQIPDDEWDYIKRATNARLPSDVQGPRPQPKSLGDYAAQRENQPSDEELSQRLIDYDDRADQDKAKAAARSFLKKKPSAQVTGDQTEHVVEALLQGLNDISTPNVRAELDFSSSRNTATLRLLAVQAEEKTILSEIGDIAKTVYDEFVRRFSSHSWVRTVQNRIRVVSKDERIIELLLDEWRDMGFVGEPIAAYNHIYPILLKKAKPEILPVGKRWSPSDKYRTAGGSMAAQLNQSRHQMGGWR